MLRFANPTLFLKLVRWLIPLAAGASAVLLAWGLYLVFAVSPEDYQQGATVRIMYIHVPAAWLALSCYSLMALSSVGSLVWKHPLADVSAKALAPIGAAFTFLCLVTGALWGKPMWGTWWVWDARLTSVLVLFLVYCGIMALWTAFDDPARAARPVAILTLFGFINVPIVKFSVDWWNTLHQPASVFRLGGPSIDPSMLTPLFVMAGGATALMLALHLAGMRTEIMRRRVRNLSQQLARQDGGS
ncbi:MAG: heme ABC transporter permease [Rhizobiales bacterium]|jgi:heme exporter protein C|nr:heme ABC transporter permease [Hyphomicrobiales bacterium]